MADRTHNQVLDDSLDRSGDFFPPVPVTNLSDGFFHRVPRRKIRRYEAVSVQPIMTRNGSGEGRTPMGGEAGELSFVPTPSETAGLGGEAVGHRNAVPPRMRDGQPPVITVKAIEAAGLERTNAVAYIVAYAIPRIHERIIPIRIEERR